NSADLAEIRAVALRRTVCLWAYRGIRPAHDRVRGAGHQLRAGAARNAAGNRASGNWQREALVRRAQMSPAAAGHPPTETARHALGQFWTSPINGTRAARAAVERVASSVAKGHPTRTANSRWAASYFHLPAISLERRSEIRREKQKLRNHQGSSD